MNRIKQVLLQRLEKKGVEPDIIPSLIKDIANAIQGITNMNLEEVNKRLSLLGWDNFELDEHTLQLVIAHLEGNGLNDFEP